MANIPVQGANEDTWGTDLNAFLEVIHEPTGADGGKLKVTALDGRSFTGTLAFPATTSIGNVSATEIAYVDGVTSAIQTQLNDTSSTLAVHKNSNTVHGITGSVVGTSDSQTLTNKTLTNPIINDTSAITVSSTKINYLSNVTSDIQTQLNDSSSTFAVHAANDTIHIDNAQNSLLDGITTTYTKINYVSNVTSDIQTQLDDTSSNIEIHKNSGSAHGVVGDIVGTSGEQTLNQKTLTNPIINDTSAITVSSTKINYLSNVASDIQIQISDTSSLLYTHILDSSSVHGIIGYVVGTTDSQTLTNKTLTTPIINDTSTISTTSAQINRLDNSLTDTKILYYDSGTNRILSSSDTSATYTNVGAVVAGSASNADALHTHNINSTIAFPSRNFAVDYQPDTSTSTFVTISTSHAITTGGGSAYIEVLSDTSTSPSTVIATSGIQTGLLNDAATFTTSFIVRKSNYYRVDKTETNGTVSVVNWTETLITTG